MPPHILRPRQILGSIHVEEQLGRSPKVRTCSRGSVPTFTCRGSRSLGDHCPRRRVGARSPSGRPGRRPRTTAPTLDAHRSRQEGIVALDPAARARSNCAVTNGMSQATQSTGPRRPRRQCRCAQTAEPRPGVGMVWRSGRQGGVRGVGDEEGRRPRGARDSLRHPIENAPIADREQAFGSSAVATGGAAGEHRAAHVSSAGPRLASSTKSSPRLKTVCQCSGWSWARERWCWQPRRRRESQPGVAQVEGELVSGAKGGRQGQPQRGPVTMDPGVGSSMTMRMPFGTRPPRTL